MSQIYFDGRFINPDSPDGITRFSLGLIQELSKLEPLTVLVHRPEQLSLLPTQVSTMTINDPTSFSELFLARRLNKTDVKVLFSPMQTTSSVGRKFKLVLTLHDMIYYRHRKPPGGFNWLVRLGWFLFHLSYLPQRLVLNRADQIVTVSETSKRQIQSASLTTRPIEVIYNASGGAGSKIRVSTESRDLVYMGSFIDYKNVDFLVRAMAQLPEFRLVLLSRIDPQQRSELQALVAPTGGEVVFNNGVTEAEYQEILSRSFALVSASKDEGFGIPVVEAMAHGLPVVVSDIEIFREIAADAGLYFNNEDPGEFASKIRMLADQSEWKSRSSLALKRAQGFSWATSADKLHRILKSLT